ncbi:MAG TPA: hypothetical protein VMW43_07555 [Bacteroidota bacterium]|nr:hypothetical protein [Bacteroidota bacterium]
MTTKAPSTVQEFTADTIEKKAYESVAGIATREPNDRFRLGYHIWRFLTVRNGTLENAVAESGARLSISREDAVAIIRASLEKNGITV